MLIKETKDVNKWRDISCSWISRLTIINMWILSKLIIYRFNIISIKIPQCFCIDKLILKFIQKGKIDRKAKIILKRIKMEKSHYQIFKTYTSYSNPDHVVLVKGQAHRSTKENTKSGNRPIQTWLIDSSQRYKRNSVKKNSLLNKWF